MIEIEKRRKDVAEALVNRNKILAIIGPCALHCDPLIAEEGAKLKDFGECSENIETLHRIPVWKPRTPRVGEHPWEGVDTTEPAEALRHVRSEWTDNTKIAIEVSTKEHIARYNGFLSMAWIGSRNADNQSLISMASRDPSLSKMPLGIKNDLHGDICSTVAAVNQINMARNNGTPATMIFRGGTNAMTPEEWEVEYRRAFELTAGSFIVDVAHGSEIAHDRNNQKSVTGQLAAAEHVVKLAEEGLMPSGIMMEASDIHIEDVSRRTDPNIPFARSLDILGELENILNK